MILEVQSKNIALIPIDSGIQIGDFVEVRRNNGNPQAKTYCAKVFWKKNRDPNLPDIEKVIKMPPKSRIRYGDMIEVKEMEL